MAYALPPSTARSTVNLAAGTATAVILGAAGGLAYRIYAWQMDISRLATGVTDLDIRSTTTIILAGEARGLQLTGTSGQHMEFPFPGFQMPVGESITFQTISTVAAGNAQLLLWYYIDTVP